MVEQRIIIKKMIEYWRYSTKRSLNITFVESDGIDLMSSSSTQDVHIRNSIRVEIDVIVKDGISDV